MHFCDDQVFLEQCRFQERKDTCTPFPADCFDLFDIYFVKIILNIIKVSDNGKSIVILP